MYTGHSIVYQDASGRPTCYPLDGHPRKKDADQVKSVGLMLSEYQSNRVTKPRGHWRERVGMPQDNFDPRGGFLLIKTFGPVDGPNVDERDVVIAPGRGIVASFIRREDIYSTYARLISPSYLLLRTGAFQMESPVAKECDAGIYGLDLRSGKLTHLADLQILAKVGKQEVDLSQNVAATVVEGLFP